MEVSWYAVKENWSALSYFIIFQIPSETVPTTVSTTTSKRPPATAIPPAVRPDENDNTPFHHMMKPGIIAGKQGTALFVFSVEYCRLRIDSPHTVYLCTRVITHELSSRIVRRSMCALNGWSLSLPRH